VLSFEASGWNVYDYDAYVEQNRIRNIWISEEIPATDDAEIIKFVHDDPSRYSFTHTNCWDRTEAALVAGGMPKSLIRRPVNVQKSHRDDSSKVRHQFHSDSRDSAIAKAVTGLE